LPSPGIILVIRVLFGGLSEEESNSDVRNALKASTFAECFS